MKKIFLQLIDTLLLLTLVSGETIAESENCDHSIHIKEEETVSIVSPNFPLKYPFGSSCKYRLQAPANYELHFECNMDLYRGKTHGSCSHEILYIDHGEPQLLPDSHFYCGYGAIRRRSKSNIAVIKYVSSSDHGGRFNCSVKAVPRRCVCGWGVTKRSILTGIRTYNYEFPAVVGIVHLSQQRIICQAALIHRYYLLSAAHCFSSDPNLSAYGLLLGNDKFEKDHYIDGLLNHGISEIIPHDGFQEDTYANDIALLKIDDYYVAWNALLGPACLPFKIPRNKVVGCTADVAGWDWKFLDNDRISYNILKTTYYLLNSSSCTSVERSWCARASRRTICERDPGTPVFYRDDRIYLVGIVSNTKDCDTKSSPIVMDIYGYMDWIIENVPDLSVCKK